MKKRGIAITCLTALLMSGCGAVLPEMTDAQAQAIGEYAAITLLKYDAVGRSRLVDLSLIEEEPEAPVVLQEPPSWEEPVPETQDTPVIDNSMSETAASESLENCLELPEGINLVYTGYDVAPSYEEEGRLYLAVEASEGKQLLILKFALQNTSGTEQTLDLMESRSSYRVTVNGSYTRKALTTMLSNDLLTYVGTVSAGGTEEVVLLVEVESERLGSVDSITLNLKNESKTCTIQLL